MLKPAVLGWVLGGHCQWRPDGVLAADLVQRNLNPSGPDQLWAPEMTQFRTGKGGYTCRAGSVLL